MVPRWAVGVTSGSGGLPPLAFPPGVRMVRPLTTHFEPRNEREITRESVTTPPLCPFTAHREGRRQPPSTTKLFMRLAPKLIGQSRMAAPTPPSTAATTVATDPFGPVPCRGQPRQTPFIGPKKHCPRHQIRGRTAVIRPAENQRTPPPIQGLSQFVMRLAAIEIGSDFY